jgi:hypothetical protein
MKRLTRPHYKVVASRFPPEAAARSRRFSEMDFLISAALFSWLSFSASSITPVVDHEELSNERQRIDAIDGEILSLLQERAGCA